MNVAFGEFELDEERHELRRQGAVVPVEPQVFALLAHLVRERRRVVSRDELIEAIWEGRFVSDSAVSSRIKSARQALGDDGQAQRYIKTIHGRGFRFVAEVTVLEDELRATDIARSDALQIDRSKNDAARFRFAHWLRSRVGLSASVGLLLLLAIGTWITIFSGVGRAAIEPSRFAILPTENATGRSELEWARLGLMSLVSERISKAEGIHVVPPSAILPLVDGMSGDRLDAMDPGERLSEQLRVGQGASHIVLSRLTRANGLLRLDFVLLPPDGQREEGSVGAEKVSELADMMARRILARVAGGTRAELPKNRLFDDPFVSEAYARGLALDLEGKADEARELFAVAMKQQPDDIWLRYQFALMTRKMGLLDEAQEQLLALRTEAKQGEENEALVSILNALGVLGLRQGDIDPAIGYLVEALPLSQARGDHERTASILVNLGILQRRKKDLKASEGYLTRAFAAFDAAGISPPSGQLLNTMALLRYEQGKRDEALTYLERARDRFQFDGNRRALGAVLNNLGDMKENGGDYQGALTFYQQAYDQRQAVGDPFGIDSSLGTLAQISILMGRLDDAEGFAQDLLKHGLERGDSAEQARGHVYLGDIFRHRREAGLAREHYNRSIALFSQAKQEEQVIRVQVELALTELLAGNRTRAAALANAALSWARANGRPHEIMTAQGALGQIARSGGNTVQAKAHFEAALGAARRLPDPVHQGRVLARLGLVLLDRGDRASAIRLGDEAARFAPNEPDLFRLWAGIAKAEGKSSDATRHMQRAKVLAGQRWTPEDESGLASLLNA